jgi:hypothetical protein
MNEIPCPSCGTIMVQVYLLIGGGVRLSQSKKDIESLLAFHKGENFEWRQETPVQCVIGNRGYLSGTWPKNGLHCPACHTFVVSP